MEKIAIVADSTANLSKEWIDKYNIHTVPLKVHWGDETYLDGIDLTSSEFYKRLKISKILPTTSQPSPQDFLKTYERLAEEGASGILVPLISSGISGTVDSARTAASQFNKVPVEIVDTRITSIGQMMIIIAAARAIEQGANLQEAKRVAEDVVNSLKVFFAVDTLEYLHRGGRINGAARYLGTALDIKPILYMNSEGKIDALERVRTKKKALQRLITLAEEKAGGKLVTVGIVHADDLQTALEFRSEVEKRLNYNEIFLGEFSPVIGVHVGPGTIGIGVHPAR